MKKIIRISIVLTVLLCIALNGTVSLAYELPQKYSSDSYKTEIPEVVIPDEPEEQTVIYAYLNLEKIPLTVAPVIKNDTVYIPVEEFFMRLGFTVSTKGKISISNENVNGEFKKNSNKGTVNGKEVKLSNKIASMNGVLMAPAGIAAEVLNAKVWYDADSMTLAVSTGKYKDDNILRIINYKFWMNGEPYYEISFNKWDLCYQISAEYTNDGGWAADKRIAGAEEALRLLHEYGFRTIRVFAHSGLRANTFEDGPKKDQYYELMDTMFDLCDKYEIQMVVCMQLPAGEFCCNGEDFFDLICNRESASRQRMYGFIDEYVTRYKTRYSVLMWEVVNEGNLECDIGWQVKQNKYSLYQLGQFYADCAERIHMNDPDRLVTGGDACLRSSQWNLYLGIKEGMIGPNWALDTLEQRLMAYQMLYYGLDVVSVHCYNTGYNGTAYPVSSEDPTMVTEDFALLQKEVKRIGKVLYNGETAVDADNYTYENTYEKSVQFIQDMIDNNVQLTHWWTFATDNTYHAPKTGWQLRDGELLEAIMDGNRSLKEKYVVNYISAENTNNAWTDEPDFYAGAVLTEVDESLVPKGCFSGISEGGTALTVICGIVVVSLAVTVLPKKKKCIGKI